MRWVVCDCSDSIMTPAALEILYGFQILCMGHMTVSLQFDIHPSIILALEYSSGRGTVFQLDFHSFSRKHYHRRNGSISAALMEHTKKETTSLTVCCLKGGWEMLDHSDRLTLFTCLSNLEKPPALVVKCITCSYFRFIYYYFVLKLNPNTIIIQYFC